MRKALTLAACLLLASAGVSVAQELPSAQESVEHLVEIWRTTPERNLGTEYFRYTLDLALEFDVELSQSESVLPPPESAWRVSSNVDPLTDERLWVLQSVANEGRSVYGDRPVLVLRWQAGRTEMYIRWDSYISDDDRTVTWRIGDAQAVNERLSLSTDNQATFFPSRTVVGMIQRLMDADQFVVRITPYSANPITAVFDIRGLRAEANARPDLAGWLDVPDQEPDAPTASDTNNWVKPLSVPRN